MSIFVVRHGLSEANNRDNKGTPAYGAKDASLMQQGREQARARGERLVLDYGIDLSTTPVAVSQLLRTWQTAKEMGFDPNNFTRYAVLNELERDVLPDNFRELLRNNQYPSVIVRAGQALLRQPPPQKVWVAHGLIIAGLCCALGVSDQFERSVPNFCEVRELSI